MHTLRVVVRDRKGVLTREVSFYLRNEGEP